MKKIFLFSVFIAVFAISCNSEEKEIIDSSAKNNLERLNLSVIGIKKGDEITLNVSSNKLLEVFKEFSKTNELEINPLYSKIEKINGKDYLRFYNDDETVSTIELFIDENNIVSTGSVVCTSTACASCCGCVPDGLYCTKCVPPEAGPLGSGDCKRTTTGISEGA